MTPSQLANSSDVSEILATAVCRVRTETCPEVAAAVSSETSVSVEQLSWRRLAFDLNLLQNGVTGPAHAELRVDVRTSEC